MATSYVNTAAPAFGIPHPRYVTVVRMPSMSVSDASIMTQVVGQYNRGLCSGVEMIEELNRRITSCGMENDPYRFNLDTFHIGAGFHMALEPFFHGTMPDRIAFRVHLLDYR